MLRKANNVFSVLLNDASKLTANLPVTTAGTVVSDSNLEVGAIVVTDLGLQRLSAAEYTALNDGDRFLIVQGKGVGVPLMKSPILTKGKIKLSAARFKAAVQQVTSFGYNGTTGALPTSNNTDFWIKIRKQDNDAANRSQPMSLFAGPVKTDSTGTQAELAMLLVESGYKNFTAQEPANGYLKMEAICADAGAAITGTATSLGVVYKSKGVSIVGGTVTNVVVGDFIRLGGTTTTTPVYRVTAVTATMLTLDTPYVSPSATVLIANVEVIAAATAATSAFGIRVTGVPANFNVNTFRDYYSNRFTATFSDSSTLKTHTMGAFNGNGVWQQVAMDEYMNYGFEGQNNQLAIPSTPRDQAVKIPGVNGSTALTSKYCALNIAWEESISGLVTMAGGKGNVVIYVNLTDAAGLGKISTPTTTTGNELITVFGGPTAFGVAALTDLDEI